MGKTSPLDFFKPGTEYVSSETAAERMSICEACPDLIAGIKVCKNCGCVMKLKTTLAEAECPIGKW